MNMRTIPQFDGNVAQWAKRLTEYLRSSSSEVNQHNNPQPILLPHQVTGVTSRTTTDGLLMFAPTIGAPVYSNGGVWETLLAASVAANTYVKLDGTSRMTGNLDIGDYDNAGLELYNAASQAAVVQVSSTGELRLKSYNDAHIFYGGSGGPATAPATSTVMSRKMSDARYLQLTGGSLSGNLDLTGGAIFNVTSTNHVPLRLTREGQTWMFGQLASTTNLLIQKDFTTVADLPPRGDTLNVYSLLRLEDADALYLPLSGGTMTGMLTLLDPGDVNNTMFEGGNATRRIRLFHSASTSSNYIGFVPRNSGDTGYLFASRLAWDVALQKWCIGTDYIATKASLSSLVDAFQSAGAITAGQATTIKGTL